MKTRRSILAAVVMASAALHPARAPAHDFVDQAVVTPLMSQHLAGLPKKVGTMLTVEYPPGGRTDKHRHPGAHTFVYVLSGALEMQVEGKALVRLGPGQTYYESPDDVHVVSRNASATEPARFLVLLVQDEGSPPVVPVP